MSDLNFLTDSEPRNPIGEWAVRGGVTVLAGAMKEQDDSGLVVIILAIASSCDLPPLPLFLCVP